MSSSSTFLLSAGLVAGLLVTASAQTPTGSQSSPSVPASVTLTGCLDRADDVQAAAGTTADVDSLSFVLTHAVKGAGAELKSETVGTSGRAMEPVKGTTYRLDAPTEKLNAHVGHKIEVTGTLETAAPPKSGDTTATPAPRVKVATVKMLAETCAR
jgi:hypothetical protein